MNDMRLAAPGELAVSDRQQITEFLDSQDSSHPFQLLQWLTAENCYAAPSTRVAIFRRDGQIRWIASGGVSYPYRPALPGFGRLTIACGPVCDDAEIWAAALTALRKAAKEQGIASIQLSPEMTGRRSKELQVRLLASGAQPSSEARLSLRLDLSRDEDTLLASFRKTTRYEIRRARRIGIRVEPFMDRSEISEFLQIYSGMLQRKRLVSDPADRVQRVLEWLLTEPGRGTLLLARHRGKILGGAVLARAAKRCWYVWGAAERYPYASVGYPLQWHALRWAKSQGCREYDFGGYRENAISGPALFKRGFRGTPVQFIDGFTLPVNHQRLWLVQQLQKCAEFCRPIQLHPRGVNPLI
jgi:hypothetical protein